MPANARDQPRPRRTRRGLPRATRRPRAGAALELGSRSYRGKYASNGSTSFPSAKSRRLSDSTKSSKRRRTKASAIESAWNVSSPRIRCPLSFERRPRPRIKTGHARKRAKPAVALPVQRMVRRSHAPAHEGQTPRVQRLASKVPHTGHSHTNGTTAQAQCEHARPTERSGRARCPLCRWPTTAAV